MGTIDGKINGGDIMKGITVIGRWIEMELWMEREQ